MKYELDELLKDAYGGEDTKTVTSKLNQEMIDKVHSGESKFEKRFLGFGNFAKVILVSGCACLVVVAIVSAVMALTPRIKDDAIKEAASEEIVSEQESSEDVEETTNYYSDLKWDNPDVQYRIEDDTLIVYGNGKMGGSMKDKLEAHKYDIKKVVIDEGVLGITSGAFKGYAALEGVEMADTVVRIESNAFSGCEKLKEIKWSKGLEIIDSYAFANCTSLIKVVIPEGVTELGGYVFEECSNLENINIPSSIKVISIDDFYGTKWIENLQEDENGFIVVDAILISGANAKGHVVIPDNIKIIGEYAFYRSEVESVIIPEGVVEIGYETFGKCSNLQSINIPSTVNSIDSGTFRECSKLKNIEISVGIKNVGSSAFEMCESLECIEIPEGVEWIGSNTFEGCKNLVSIKLPRSLEKVGNWLFWDCKSLRTIHGTEGSYAEKLAMYGDYLFEEE